MHCIAPYYIVRDRSPLHTPRSMHCAVLSLQCIALYFTVCVLTLHALCSTPMHCSSLALCGTLYYIFVFTKSECSHVTMAYVLCEPVKMAVLSTMQCHVKGVNEVGIMPKQWSLRTPHLTTTLYSKRQVECHKYVYNVFIFSIIGTSSTFSLTSIWRNVDIRITIPGCPGICE